MKFFILNCPFVKSASEGEESPGPWLKCGLNNFGEGDNQQDKPAETDIKNKRLMNG